MSNIVRAWKDETYRQSLSTQEQAALPANPAGEIELTDAQLAGVYGSMGDAINDSHDDNHEENATATFNYSDYDDAIKAKIVCTSANNVEIEKKKHLRRY